MMRKLMYALCATGLLFSIQSAFAADTTVTKVTAKPVATAKKSMTEKGTFHTLHDKKEKLDCDDCHEKAGLPDNTIFLRLHESPGKNTAGLVSADNCLECHSKPGKKGKTGKSIQWYALTDK